MLSFWPKRTLGINQLTSTSNLVSRYRPRKNVHWDFILSIQRSKFHSLFIGGWLSSVVLVRGQWAINQQRLVTQLVLVPIRWVWATPGDATRRNLWSSSPTNKSKAANNYTAWIAVTRAALSSNWIHKRARRACVACSTVCHATKCQSDIIELPIRQNMLSSVV